MKRSSTKRSKSFFNNIWKVLVGSRKQFSEANRTVNAVCVITIGFLKVSMATNIALMLMEPMLLNLICMLILVGVYALARFRKMYKAAFAIYACCCYLALITTFIYNGGIDGPALMFFFLTFHLLIAISPKQQHIIWAMLHILTGLALMTVGYYYGETVLVRYNSDLSRYVDMALSYAGSLLFVYLITINLRRNYERERIIVKRRTEQVAARSAKISEQNEKLQEIAWMQSHIVRAHVATILGLSELVNTNDISHPENIEMLKGIQHASRELDKAIYDMNEIAQGYTTQQ